MKKTVLLILLGSLAFAGCKKTRLGDVPPAADRPKAQNTDASIRTAELLREPVAATLVETSTLALPSWRQWRDSRPALVILSSDPFLQPVPAQLEKEALALALEGTTEALRRHGSFYREEPVLLPSQALSAALQGDLFSRVVWILPGKSGVEELNLHAFRDQMVRSGFMAPSEAKGWSVTKGGFEGTLRGVPFSVRHRSALPPVETPVVVHVDLSFFSSSYKDEVKTPVYDLLHGTLRGMRDAGWRALSVTVGFSTSERQVPMDMRFLGHDLAALFGRPAMLDEDLPPVWQRRAEAVYLENFYQKSAAFEKYREMESMAPDDATVQFDLFRAYRGKRDFDNAMEHLGRAVALDRGYAYQYLDLADQAYEAKKLQSALKILDHARRGLPEDPFVLLKMAQGYLEAGDLERGGALVEELREKKWSAVYHPAVPGLLQKMGTAAERKPQ